MGCNAPLNVIVEKPLQILASIQTGSERVVRPAGGFVVAVSEPELGWDTCSLWPPTPENAVSDGPFIYTTNNFKKSLAPGISQII